MTYLPNGFVGKASIWCLVYGKAEVQIPNSVWGFCGGGIVYCPSWQTSLAASPLAARRGQERAQQSRSACWAEAGQTFGAAESSDLSQPAQRRRTSGRSTARPQQHPTVRPANGSRQRHAGTGTLSSAAPRWLWARRGVPRGAAPPLPSGPFPQRAVPSQARVPPCTTWHAVALPSATPSRPLWPRAGASLPRSHCPREVPPPAHISPVGGSPRFIPVATSPSRSLRMPRAPAGARAVLLIALLCRLAAAGEWWREGCGGGGRGAQLSWQGGPEGERPRAAAFALRQRLRAWPVGRGAAAALWGRGQRRLRRSAPLAGRSFAAGGSFLREPRCPQPGGCGASQRHRERAARFASPVARSELIAAAEEATFRKQWGHGLAQRWLRRGRGGRGSPRRAGFSAALSSGAVLRSDPSARGWPRGVRARGSTAFWIVYLPKINRRGAEGNAFCIRDSRGLWSTVLLFGVQTLS